MSTLLDRGLLTDALLAALALTGKPVGDGESPIGEGGWTEDRNAPNATFVAYTVLSALTASRSTGSLADPQDTWQVPYSLLAVGARRQQSDWMAQRALEALDTLLHQQIECGGLWKVQQLWVQSVGATQRNDATDPPYWQRADSVTVFITKEI